MSRRLVSDITSLSAADLDRWVEGFQWPVLPVEFAALTELVQRQWQQACLALADEDGDAMLSEGLPGWLVQMAHASLVAAKASHAGVELVVGRQSESLYAPNWEQLARGHDQTLAQPAWRLTTRRWLRNAAFNRELPFMRRLAALAHPDAVALGSNDPLRARYVTWRELGVDNTYVSLLATGGGQPALSAALRGQISILVDGICTGMTERFGAPFDGHGLRRAIEGRLATLLAARRQARRRAKAVPLLVTESAKPLHKVAACGWRAGGGTAVGFHHGHAVGETSLPARAYTEFFAYDEFACPTEGCALAFSADYAATPLASLRPMRFVVPEAAPQFAGPVRQRPPAEFPRRVRRVMVMGYPMNPMRYLGHHSLFWAYQLELEIRLVKLLMKNGFDVLYKVHPERPHPVSEIMSALGCRVVSERFEQVVGMADAFVVKYTVSSTFPMVLGSNRPVYLLDVERALWNPAHRELLARRCVILPAEADSEGRIRFDEQSLLDGLSGEQSYPDYSYVTRHYPSY